MTLIFQQTKRHDTPLPILPFLSLSGWTKCCHFRCSCGLQFIYKCATSGASQGKSALNWSEMIFTLLSSSTGSQKCGLHQQHQSALPRILLEMQVLGATQTYWVMGWPAACVSLSLLSDCNERWRVRTTVLTGTLVGTLLFLLYGTPRYEILWSLLWSIYQGPAKGEIKE